MPLRPTRRLAPHAGHRLVTAPAVEPVTRDELRTLLRDPPTEENGFIDTCLPEARQIFEAITGLACINQTWRLTLDAWPGGREAWQDGYRELPVSELNRGMIDYVTLPRYPLSSVTGIQTYDMDNTPAAVAVSDVFYLDLASFPGRLILQDGQTWPVALRNRNAIEITYVAGFGANAAAVPATIKRAILQIAAYLFDNRGSGCSPEKIISSTGALQIASEYVMVRL